MDLLVQQCLKLCVGLVERMLNTVKQEQYEEERLNKLHD